MDLFPIHTGRLTLRRFKETDLAAFVAYRSDPEVARYQSWSSLTEAEGLAFIQDQQQAPFFVPGAWFQVAIAHQQTDELVGDIGMCVSADNPSIAELGFTLAQKYQGQGFATEAVRAILDVIFRETHVKWIEAITDSRNAASIDLLHRLDFVQNKTSEAWFKGELCTEYTFLLNKPMNTT